MIVVGNALVPERIVRCVLDHYPDVRAIYLFGSYGTAEEWPDSDVDIALLLPAEQARQQPQLAMTPCHLDLAAALDKPVDLLNARQVSTVMQKEIVRSGRRLYLRCGAVHRHENAAAEWEMLTLSLYQRLNEERKAILEAFRETGRAYEV